MESYKDLLDRKPKETPATVTIDGVDAAISYSLQQYGIISASYTETYTASELVWIREGELVELDGRRSYSDITDSVRSEVCMTWNNGAGVFIKRCYNGESRRNALKQLRAIVNAARAAIDTIGNADNPDFEAELDAAVREHVTGGEAE